ncbi:MAG: DUF1489 family protein [Sphingomonadaceae bacterium]
MPLHLTKIAYGARSMEEFLSWFQTRDEVRLTTRYLPKRHEEITGGSLYWILDHTLVARSPITGFSQTPDGRWYIHLATDLVRVNPVAKRAHQGWRYLENDKAPPDIDGSQTDSSIMPPHLARELGRLGLL